MEDLSSAASRIYLCEPFRIESTAGAVYRLRTRRTESIVAYLALNRGKWKHRDDLAAEFFPEDSAATGRPKLRLALHSIRKVLGDALQTQGEHVLLRDIWVDALDEAPAQLSSPDILPGRVEPWTLPYVLELSRRLESQSLHDLREAQDPNRRLESLIHLQTVDPLNPDYYLSLHELLRELGSRVAAMAVAKEAQAVLGSDCPPELRSGASVSHRTANPTLTRLAHAVLGKQEPIAVALVGPGGGGKTYIARELMKLAQEASVPCAFAAMAGLSSVSDTENSVRLALASLHAVESQAIPIRDLPSTLLVLDDCQELTDEAVRWLSKLMVPGSCVRLLLTSQRKLAEDMPTIPLRMKSLPSSHSEADLLGSDAVRMFLDETRCQLTSENREHVFQICRATGGLPLAIRMAARHYALGGETSPESPFLHGEPSLEVRLQRNWEVLSEQSRRDMEMLSFLRPEFHSNFAEALGVSRRVIDELSARSWIEPTGKAGTFELLPPIREALRRLSKGRTGFDLDHFNRTVVEVTESHLRGNYRLIYAETVPSLATLHEGIDHALAKADYETAVKLFCPLYFGYQRTGSTSEAVRYGDRIFGREENERWAISGESINFYGSAAYFDKQFDLAQAAYRAASRSLDPRVADLGRANLGLLALSRGRGAEAIELLENCLNADHLVSRQRANRLNNLAKALALAERYEEAVSRAKEGIELCAEDEELAAIRALTCFSLAEIHAMDSNWAETDEWCRRSIRFFERNEERRRLLDARLLRAYALVCMGKRKEAVEFLVKSGHLDKPEFAAVHWAPGAAAVLLAVGAGKEAQEVSRGLDLLVQPNWIQHIAQLGGHLCEAESCGYVPSNLERALLFAEVMKRF